MNATRRRQTILEVLNKTGECDVSALAIDLDVSEMTIRRDLNALKTDGRVLRTHGGAVPAERVSFEFQFLKRIQENSAAKEALAVIAANLVKDGQSVIMDSGTTTLAVARQLKSKKVTIITTSLPIASELQYSDSVRVILLGGILRRESPDLAGALTENNLEQLQADIAFLGTHGIDDTGRYYTEPMELARVLRKIAAAARRVYVVADSSKIGQSALAVIGKLSDTDGLITDAGLKPAQAARLKRAGVKIIK